MLKLYFAYGSNMDTSQMRVRCPSAELVGRAVLDGYRFVIMSRGYASIVPDPDQSVPGVLWNISPRDEKSLDRYEGVSSDCYFKTYVEVADCASGERVRAMVYVATDNTAGRPRPKYLDNIIAAAKYHGLSADHIKMLESLRQGAGEHA